MSEWAELRWMMARLDSDPLSEARRHWLNSWVKEGDVRYTVSVTWMDGKTNVYRSDDYPRLDKNAAVLTLTEKAGITGGLIKTNNLPVCNIREYEVAER